MPLDVREALLDLLIILQPYFLPKVDHTCACNIAEARVVVAPLCDLLKKLANRDVFKGAVDPSVQMAGSSKCDSTLPPPPAPPPRALDVELFTGPPMNHMDLESTLAKVIQIKLDAPVAPSVGKAWNVNAEPFFPVPQLPYIMPLAALPLALQVNVPPPPPLADSCEHSAPQPAVTTDCDSIFSTSRSASFTTWATTTIEQVLVTNGGCMHVNELQNTLVEQYLSADAQPIYSRSHVGLFVLALIPESYLSNTDAMVRLTHDRHLRMKRYSFLFDAAHDPNGTGVAHDCNQQ